MDSNIEPCPSIAEGQHQCFDGHHIIEESAVTKSINFAGLFHQQATMLEHPIPTSQEIFEGGISKRLLEVYDFVQCWRPDASDLTIRVNMFVVFGSIPCLARCQACCEER